MSVKSLSRRSFVAGTAAAAGALALADLSLDGSPVAKADGGTITAACSYQSTNYSPCLLYTSRCV